jgi:hypothetical protein
MQTPDSEHFEDLAKILTAMCVRATQLEEIHSGKTPVTNTGDYSDVKVIDAEGNEISWAELSRIDNDEMKTLMKEIVNRMYTFFMNAENPTFSKQTDYFRQFTLGWDEPEIVEKLK